MQTTLRNLLNFGTGGYLLRMLGPPVAGFTQAFLQARYPPDLRHSDRTWETYQSIQHAAVPRPRHETCISSQTLDLPANHRALSASRTGLARLNQLRTSLGWRT